MQQRPWYLSTIVIILAFLIFWPAGIVLILLRAKGSSMDKQAVFKGASNQKIYILGGAILIILGIANLFSGDSKWIWGLFMIIGGGVLIYYSTTIANTAARNRDYIDMIINQDIDDVNAIAAACGVTVATAEKEISQLIAIGVLKNTTLDTNSHIVTFVRPAISQQTQATGSFAGEAPVGGELVTVACPGCGAKMTMRRGTSCKCEYCDAPITV